MMVVTEVLPAATTTCSRAVRLEPGNNPKQHVMQSQSSSRSRSTRANAEQDLPSHASTARTTRTPFCFPARNHRFPAPQRRQNGTETAPDIHHRPCAQDGDTACRDTHTRSSLPEKCAHVDGWMSTSRGRGQGHARSCRPRPGFLTASMSPELPRRANSRSPPCKGQIRRMPRRPMKGGARCSVTTSLQASTS